MWSERTGVLLVLTALAGCEQVDRIKAARAYHARADELLQAQRDLIAKRRELQKTLEEETWNRPKDYLLQREGTKIMLWRWNGDPPDKEGNRQGRICVLNPEPREPYSCDVQQRKIGRILLDIEENDRRFDANMKDFQDNYRAATESPKPTK
jgi:hypothetical protein